VKEKRFINFGQSLQDRCIGSDFIAQLDKGTDDIKTHGNRAVASKNIRGLKRTVLGKRLRRLGFDITFCDINVSISSLLN